jgi:hypothetical protein
MLRTTKTIKELNQETFTINSGDRVDFIYASGGNPCVSIVGEGFTIGRVTDKAFEVLGVNGSFQWYQKHLVDFEGSFNSTQGGRKLIAFNDYFPSRPNKLNQYQQFFIKNNFDKQSYRIDSPYQEFVIMPDEEGGE